VRFRWRCVKIGTSGTFGIGKGKSDPYLILSLPNRSGVIKQTETIFKTLDPEWAPFFLTVAEFCGGVRRQINPQPVAFGFGAIFHVPLPLSHPPIA